MDLLIAIIPALPLAGFLFAVLLGPRLDRVPAGGTHGGPEGPGVESGHGHTGHDEHAPAADSPTADAHAAAGGTDEADLGAVPSEDEQARTSPHAGHADDLANAEGADGVIPPDLNDGLGQSGHVTPDATQPRYMSWIVPTLAVFVAWALSMIVFGSVIFGGNEYHVTLYEWIGAGDFHVQIGFLVDSLTAMLLLVVSSVGLLIHVYSIGYMNGDRGFWRFFAYLNLFMLSMLLLILADNFLLLYVGW